MIGLDTNILVRYLAQDDPIQSPQATAIFEQLLTAEMPGFVSLPAMLEAAWVLQRSYGLAGPRLAAILENLLQNARLVLQHEAEIFAAMVAVREGQGSFADALIANLGRSAGCSQTLTFDRNALNLPGFALP